MVSRAEQVLGRVSHQRAADVGSLTGKMMAIENPQSMTNINRVYCQAGLLSQQQRRLDDPHISAFIKSLMEHRMEDDTSDIDSLVVRRQLSLVAHQTLVRLQSLLDSVTACESMSKSNDLKMAKLAERRTELERTRARHEILSECDTLAGNVMAKFASTAKLLSEAKVIANQIGQKKERLASKEALSVEVKEELSQISSRMQLGLSRLRETKERIVDLASPTAQSSQKEI